MNETKSAEPAPDGGCYLLFCLPIYLPRLDMSRLVSVARKVEQE